MVGSVTQRVCVHALLSQYISAAQTIIDDKLVSYGFDGQRTFANTCVPQYRQTNFKMQRRPKPNIARRPAFVVEQIVMEEGVIPRLRTASLLGIDV